MTEKDNTITKPNKYIKSFIKMHKLNIVQPKE